MALEDKLETYVPGVINGDVATVDDLLGMTSGIPDFTANEGFLRRFTANPTMRWSDADTLAVIAEAKATRLCAGGEGGLLRLQLRPIGDDHRRGHG